MQVGNIYIDLEIPDFNLKEFLEVTDCYALEIVETAGTSLPTALMVFKARNDKVINGINENTSVIIRVGDSPENCDSFTVYPQIIKPHRNSEDNTWVIEFGGFIGARDYMVNQKSEAIKGTSIDVIKKIFPKDQIITDIEETKENEVNWRLINETYCQFAIDTILHMDIRPSFPLVGIDKMGKMYLRDFEKQCKAPIKAYFVPYEPQRDDCFQYLNNFNIESYKPAYDLFAGFNRITQVTKAEAGAKKSVLSPNTPVIASSKISEKTEAGINQTLNILQSDNVHKTFTEAYVYNTNKLVSMSSIVGEILLSGYFRNVAPTDMVYVVDNGEVGQVLTGRYIVDTISTVVNFSTGTVLTRVYVTRDNKNNVENYVKKRKGLKISSKLIQQLSDAVSSLRVAYAFCQEIMDGTYLSKLLSWGLETKRNLLQMFSIAGVTIDFNSQADLVRSLMMTGNSLMNTLVDMIFPEDIASVLHDFIINKPTLIGIIGSYVSQYVPEGLQSTIMRLLESIFHVSDSLNSIARDNGIIISRGAVKSSRKESSQNEDETVDEQEVESPSSIIINTAQEKVYNMIDNFVENTTGLDIPFPIIELTESQALMPDEELTEYVIDKTFSNLVDLGYLDNTERDRNMLEEVLTTDPDKNRNKLTELKNIIEGNIGYRNQSKYRYWGTFGATKDALYAWTYKDEDSGDENTIYTKSENVTELTRLYNANYSPYVPIVSENTSREIFEVTEVEGEQDKYIITFEGYETQRNEEEDIIPNSLIELTSFKIKDSFKDLYRTIPCTKLINATDNQRIFFACPQNELDLVFYINSKRVILPSFEIDLGALGNGNVGKINDIGEKSNIYTVYYTLSGYNSNSVLFEVKKGGMV